MVKKILALILIITFAFTGFSGLSVSAIGVQSGSLNYWYSDASEIRKWTTKPSIWVGNVGDGFTSVELNSYVTHARSQWTVAGIPTSLATSKSNASIRIQGGTYTVLKAMESALDSDTNGYATPTGGLTHHGIYTYGASYKTVNYFKPHVDVYIVSKNRTDRNYKKTTTHEIGHALGWRGHSSDTNDIMYSKGSEVTGLTSRDKNHLVQIYD